MKKKIILSAIVIIIILAIIGSASDKKTSNETVKPTAVTKNSTSPTIESTFNENIQEGKNENNLMTQEDKPEYEIKHRDENIRVENYEILINPGDSGEAAALDVKKQCKKPCNIFVYDDTKAQQLDREYDEISDGQSATAWKQQNYVYVADHLVGNIDFETGEWNDYPYRDFYYREHGGKN